MGTPMNAATAPIRSAGLRLDKVMVDGFRLTSARIIEMFRNDGTQTYVNTGKTAPSYGTEVAYMVSAPPRHR
jgi:hypothetical protein